MVAVIIGFFGRHMCVTVCVCVGVKMRDHPEVEVCVYATYQSVIQQVSVWLH